MYFYSIQNPNKKLENGKPKKSNCLTFNLCFVQRPKSDLRGLKEKKKKHKKTQKSKKQTS